MSVPMNKIDGTLSTETWSRWSVVGKSKEKYGSKPATSALEKSPVNTHSSPFVKVSSSFSTSWRSIIPLDDIAQIWDKGTQVTKRSLA